MVVVFDQSYCIKQKLRQRKSLTINFHAPTITSDPSHSRAWHVYVHLSEIHLLISQWGKAWLENRGFRLEMGATLLEALAL